MLLLFFPSIEQQIFKAVEKSIMAEITKPTKGTKYIVRFFAIFLAIALVVTLVVWLMSLLAGR